MRRILILTPFILFLYACHKEKNHPKACFTVDNPTMLLGDTVRIKFCPDAKISRDSEWEMGDGTTSKESIPKHVYQTQGTYTIKLISNEHINPVTHFQKRAVSEAQQTVTVQ